MRLESADAFIARKRARFERDRAKPIRMKDIGRRGFHCWEREALTLVPQRSLRDDKIFSIERLRRLPNLGRVVYRHLREGEVYYRIGYFMRGQIGRARGRWTWGQYCPMIPRPELSILLTKARREGTIK